VNRILTKDVWIEARKLARTARSRQVAIAYVTRDLIGFRDGDTLICDASKRAIRSGQTDAKLLLTLHNNGVAIYSTEGLHSKVILFGRHAILGSANMSGSGLIEASVVTDNPQITSGIASFIAQLSPKNRALKRKQIEALCKIEVVRTGWPGGKRKPKVIRRLGATTWIVSVKELVRAPSKTETRLISRANADLNDRHETKDREYEWIRWSKGAKFSKKCREGDTLIQIWSPRGNGRKLVTRRLPVLLKRNEPNCVRFYTGDAQRDSDEIGWSHFQRVLKAAGYDKYVGPNSVQALDPEIAGIIDRKWTRVS
jgi:hypothetical protein